METISGVASAVVTDANDPGRRGRVQIRVLTRNDVPETWARTIRTTRNSVATEFREGDEVLVAFEHGDVRMPYVIGFLWSGKDTPPERRP